jgi:hypothetical protein
LSFAHNILSIGKYENTSKTEHLAKTIIDEAPTCSYIDNTVLRACSGMASAARMALAAPWMCGRCSAV